MPVIKLQHVHSVSSEDPHHRADNLLNPDTYRKWKCRTVGEKQGVVVLQLEQSSLIHSLDIGNEGSAFVEVLLGRSSAPDVFEVLLGMSTFMTPSESKAWSNSNRVRMFGKEKLVKEVAEQRWDRIKIVCTQPFNKKEQYGLSFVKFHSPPDLDATPPLNPTTKLGAFSLKEETQDLPTGSFFFKKESSTSSSPGNMAAQARAATSKALKSDQSNSPMRRPPLATSKDKKRTAESTADTRPTKKIKANAQSSSNKTGQSSSSITVPFKQIMAGVVFSLSGFKNPFRGDLRGKAIAMGAVFQPDWTDSCTHLVCAFPNTPKFNQVKAKGGLIVTKEWVLDSHVKKRRLPAKLYCLGGGDDGEYDKKEKVMFGGGQGDEDKSDPIPDDTPPLERAEDCYDDSTEEEDSDSDEVQLKPLAESSEYDTEDEIEKARETAGIAMDTNDPYGGSTDEEEPTAPQFPSNLTQLPDLFSECTFLLYGNYTPSDRHLITRYITAYDGTVVEYMSKKVTHVVSLEEWDHHFDQALSENSKLIFVRPQWVFVCHKEQTLVPHKTFIITAQK